MQTTVVGKYFGKRWNLSASSITTPVRVGKPLSGVAIGTFFFRTTLCPAFFLASRSWHFTFDNLPHSEEEQEEERDTRCMVSELKEAEESDGSSHSSLRSSLSSSSAKGRSSRLPLIFPSPSSLPTFCVFCVGLLSQMPTCTISVCAPLQMVSNRHVDNLVVLFNFQILFFQCSIQPRRC